MYIVLHIRLCGRVSDKLFTQPISGNKATFFFWPYVDFKIAKQLWRSCLKFKSSFRYRGQIFVNLRKSMNVYPPEISRKPIVFWWFQRGQELIKSLKFA